LEQYRKKLTPKPKEFKGTNWEGRKTGSYKWYEIKDAVDYYGEFEKKKILLPEIALKMQGTYDTSNHYSADTTYIISIDDKYLLALLNSKLVHYYFSKISSSIRGGYLRFKRQYLETIPIVEAEEFKRIIIQYVEMMLHLHKDLDNIKLATQKDQLASKISHYDKKLDDLVYQLYGLMDEEIRIMEESV
jgi:hypothetical protein